MDYNRPISIASNGLHFVVHVLPSLKKNIAVRADAFGVTSLAQTIGSRSRKPTPQSRRLVSAYSYRGAGAQPHDAALAGAAFCAVLSERRISVERLLFL